MSKIVRARNTLEYKLEAVRLVQGGQLIGAVACGLGIADQTVHNWVKAEAAGRLAVNEAGSMT
jgi:transposase